MRAPTSADSWASSGSTSNREYHTSRLRIAANLRIQRRYSATVASTIRSCSATVKPFERAAISTLTASRLTSHSHGPGSVSSKSLMSNTSRRSGEANRPKFDRWASPQACTSKPGAGGAGEVGRHDQRRPAVERERRGGIRP